MLAPTREQVAVAQPGRRATTGSADSQPGREAALSDGNHASIGDTVVTRRNDRRLRAGSGWVKNGDRWQVLDVHRDGRLDVHDPRTHRRLTLPAGYVTRPRRTRLRPTIHGAQGLTADTCHGLVTGRESRQQLYTMLSRGRHANHAYVQVTGDGDPHTRFDPDSIAHRPRPNDSRPSSPARTCRRQPPPRSPRSATRGRCWAPQSPATRTRSSSPPSSTPDPS